MNVLKRMGLCMALLAAPLAAHAASDDGTQTVVIGVGIVGLHSFSGGDDVRDAAFTSDLRIAGLNQVYIEWYPFPYENLGFGLRSVWLGVTEKATLSGGSGSSTTTTKFTSLSNFVTVTLLPFISESGYSRIGILAGAGASSYEVEQKAGDGTVTKLSTTGPASLGQLYIDWGGDAFGARFGIGALKTKLKDVEPESAPGTKLKADASGSHAFLDLRWAF